MTAVLESRKAGPGEGDCPACRSPLERGQRIVLIRDGGLHQWVHVRHLAEPQADATAQDLAAAITPLASETP
jgi:hypothetical protein